MAKRKYTGVSKWIEYVLARALIVLLQRVPVGVSYRLGRGIGWVCYKLLKRRRQVVRRNLEIVNEWAQASQVAFDDLNLPMESQIREVFQRCGANLLSGFSLSGMSNERLAKHVELCGVEQLRASLERGRGVIVLIAHMGPWEVLAHLTGLLGQQGIQAPAAAMYRPLNNFYLDRWYKSQRQKTGTLLLSRNDGFHKPVDFLRTVGGMLGILADQRMRQGVAVPFFGQEAQTTPIPGLFARRSGASLVSLSLETVACARWRLTYDSVDSSAIDESSRRESYALIANQALERAIAHSVCDGFWFHQRFK